LATIHEPGILVAAGLPAGSRMIEDFRGARSAPGPTERLREVRRRAAQFREWFAAEPPVVYYRSFGLVRVPYPTRYGLLNACRVPTPMLHIVNRLFVVQLQTSGGVKTLLFSPSDVTRNHETPFFKRLARSFGPLEDAGRKLLSPILATVEERLAETGIPPEAVDYISYDHLHTQDVRRWLGAGGEAGYFPNAKLLVMRQEWSSAHALLPQQADWYCPHGLEGIDPAKVILLDGDVRLGDGVALMRTPGHTEGNHSLVARTPDGVMVSSENGVGPDAYAPRASRIPGVAKYSRATGMEVILNGNTLEGSIDQYLSMIQEREVAGPSPRNPEFFNVVSSSELASYWALPGITPTFSFGDLVFGTPQTTRG
jgi:hypothetical protein